MEEVIKYILGKTPQTFFGKSNWLGVKMSPHSEMIFINKITATGIETNKGEYSWCNCPKEIINTIYQRLKLNEAANK